MLDKPTVPEGPLIVSDVTNQTAVLSWKAPKDDGGSPIEKYIIEKMNIARGEWQPVNLLIFKKILFLFSFLNHSLQWEDQYLFYVGSFFYLKFNKIKLKK